MAQLTSPIAGAAHQAPVRSPFALPVDRHWSLGPATRTWPVPVRPLAPPSSRTSASRAAMPLARGQGCPLRHEPSISRAAIPASRIRGPSRHQIGPSPSQTLTGVQMNDWPLGTTATASRNTASISAQSGMWRASCFREERQCIRPRGGLVGEDIVAAQTHCQVSRQLRRRAASCSGIAAPDIDLPGPVRPWRATPRDGGTGYLHRLGAWQQNRTKGEHLSSVEIQRATRIWLG